ncbi:peroxisomal leader peptide-processing protease-like [Haliotis rufescens]|uniref:peroxisomal leader peptide-processing protease-like n=1 Tax=Haliotis rufescens TaxID=6454 RepID=UPI00201F5B94|nr:peroxisomal leader peptide-processing protease-like [Haliotis rufescens]XP_046356786.2 peroxisomal leader peptide-processing protease-like [Haliotis rufescens]XP_046356787.2 peroxisomal leader peptide-processing protease-like [Haliotis rufescens]XP_046356788.2 peroxisomal leader peptide-processing protease-like [Haliotis rufescens]XP_046356789.2 peroxisomal leader peptide-processing protease-like [Haliotis rufescens]XP_046356790.2 peroxisomal leader peptide-processing protease-like [Halioti
MEDTVRACVLTAKSPTCQTEGTGCGVIIDTRHGYVIAHSAVLAPFLLNKPEILRELESCSTQQTNLSGILNVNIEVILETLKHTSQTADYSLKNYKTALVNTNIHEKCPKQTIHTAKLRSVFKCSRFEQAMKQLMPEGNWKFADSSKDSGSTSSPNVPKDESVDGEDEQVYKLLPYFVLVQLKRWNSYNSVMRVRSTQCCRIGEPVELLATPFANLFPEIMLNSVSKGIISNLAGRNHCLILSDARCIPGSEGGPLFTLGGDDSRHLSGIVVSSMCWKNGEWIGFSLACSIHEVLGSIPRLNKLVDYDVELRKRQQGSGMVKNMSLTLEQVPLLKVGPSWGSGVILGQGQGLVITCSHVIKDSQKHTVQLRSAPHSPLQKCQVLYKSPTGTQFDLALLSCTGLEAHKSCPPLAYPTEGSRVYVVGHASFGEELDLHPSVTSGVISKVVKVNNIPVMIQTTCAVHPGASGGSVVDGQGRLLGIVVCNAKDTDTGASFPHVNMCVPFITVWPVLKEYIESGDANVLKYLNLKNAVIDRLWTLGTPAASEACLATSHL